MTEAVRHLDAGFHRHDEFGKCDYLPPTPEGEDEHYFPARVAFQLLLDLASPSIELPLTRPEYSTPPALNVIWSPLSLPLVIAVLPLADFNVPLII